jgi:YidC/Oxa1 family membrane protein insertase
MSATMDKAQRYMMMILPVFFITFLLRFPMGLVLYWVTTNLWTVGQGLITRRLVSKTRPQPGQKRTSRAAPKERNDGDAGVPAPAVAPKEERQQRTEPKRVKRKKRARR